MYVNYQRFIDTSKEISNLENDMGDVRTLLTDYAGVLRSFGELTTMQMGTWAVICLLKT